MNVALTDARADTRSTAASQKVRLTGGKSPPDAVRPAWWLWPHLLSLDAPLVALVWQRWWAHGAGVTLPASREIILGLGVWLIYLSDRLADVRGEGRMHGATRHVFAARRRNFLLPLAMVVALVLVGLAPWCLPAAEFRAGLGLLALAAGHFWLTHGRWGRGWAAWVPKEAVVGAMFGAGSAFFVVCRAERLTGIFWLGIVLFGAVCFLNCALITRWERHAEDLRERSSLLNAFPRFSARLGLVCVLVAGLSVAARSALVVPIAISAILLAALDCYKNKLSGDALRVLADVALLTPCLLSV